MPLPKAESINVLSMAAPYLPPNPDPKDQTAPAVVDDLFNTFDAGFELAKTAGGKTIDTGPIGAGGFHNSPVVVYVMQILAAEQVGVNLNFWGFSLSKTDTQKVKEILGQINSQVTSTTTISGLLKFASDDLYDRAEIAEFRTSYSRPHASKWRRSPAIRLSVRLPSSRGLGPLAWSCPRLVVL